METASNSNDSRPYLSVVVTARNDDHGGNLLRRMQTFVNALLAQAKRHEVPCELVVVDWNPPAGKPPLIDALRWPADSSPVDVRFIEVPAQLHAAYRHGEALPLYQMIAKNVGIRRARGRFILATNIDVVFSHALFEFFAQQRLRPGRMYRVDRYDAMEDVPVDAPIDEQLRYCEQHLIRINTRQGTFPVTPAGQRLIEPGDITSPESGITFGGGWYPVEGLPAESFRWVLDEADIHLPPLSGARNLILEVEPGPGVGFLPFGLRITGRDGALIQEAAVMRRQTVVIPMEPSREPTTIRLHLLSGGQQTAGEPRILNFRALSVDWDRPLAASPSGSPGARIAGEAGLRKPLGQPPPRPRLGLMSIPRRAWGGFSKLRSATGPVEIGLPLPAFLVERWRLRLRGSTATVTLDPAWFRPWRRRGHERPTEPRDLVPEGLELLWGRGWYPQENFRGESFRWAQDGAEIVLHTPAGPPRQLRLLVEPGPAVGYGPFHLRLVDSAAKTCVTATVNRRQWIDLPLPWRPGETQVLSLQIAGDTPARVLPNDSRTLHFRVLACGWAQAGSASSRAAASAGNPGAPWIPIPRAPGILLGAGWKAEFPQGGTIRWRGSPGAEVILQRRSGPKGIVVLGVEPPEGEAVELLVREGERPLATYQLRGHEQLRLDPALREGQTGVLRLSAARWSDDSATKGNPCPFRLVNAGWDGPGRAMGAPLGVETNGPAPAGPEAQSPPGAGEQSPPPLDAAALPGPTTEPLGPEFLHTNACGDFTLLAREHWFSLRGYPEFDLFSMNIDSVFCYSAHHGGAPEEFLPDPMRVYHIEHATGSGFTPEGQARLFERIAAKGIPWIDYRQVMDWAVEMRRLNTPLIFNLDDWGFANADLVERRPARTGAASSKHTTRGV